VNTSDEAAAALAQALGIGQSLVTPESTGTRKKSISAITLLVNNAGTQLAAKVQNPAGWLTAFNAAAGTSLSAKDITVRTLPSPSPSRPAGSTSANSHTSAASSISDSYISESWNALFN